MKGKLIKHKTENKYGLIIDCNAQKAKTSLGDIPMDALINQFEII